MNELQIRVEQTPGIIETNFEELEAQLRIQMQAYADLEVTEENLPERKKDVATLRKIAKAIDDRRKDVKKVYNEPLSKFEAKVKNLTKVIDEQINRINDDIQGFDAKRRAEKQRAIEDLYRSNIGEYEEFLPLAQLQRPQWLNKTCSDNEIITDIQEATLQVRTDLEVIRAMGSDIEDELIRAYKTGGNSLQAAMRRNTDYQKAAQLAAQKARVEAPAPRVEEVPTQPQETPREPQGAPFRNEPELLIRVRGIENITEVRFFLDANGIPYEEV